MTAAVSHFAGGGGGCHGGGGFGVAAMVAEGGERAGVEGDGL